MLTPNRLTGRQIAMNKRDDHGAFAYGRGYSLDRGMAHVTGCEYSRHIGLEVIGLTGESPVTTQCAAAPKIRAGDQIAPLVADDANLRRPLRIRHTAEAEKERSHLDDALRPVFRFLRVTACNRSSPCRAATTVWGTTSMFGVVWM